VLRAAETAVLRLAERPLEVEAGVVDVIERADFALLAYVPACWRQQGLAAGLFRATARLQQLNGADRIHPADLWPSTGLAQHPLEAGAAPRSPEAVRAPFEAALLRHMREPSPAHAANLSGLCAGLAAALPGGQPARCGSSPLPSSKARR
jgi:chemosensory pili system protein ChpA (sensor histidine kinase/response regulator)